MKYRKRILEKKLREYVNYFPIVAITGPRQSGKSTLIKNYLKNYSYVTFDDRTNFNLFYDDPEKFFRIYNDKIIFDEVQKAPEIFDYIKKIVDLNRNISGRFVITGSTKFSFSKTITESLAGRVGKLVLLPYEYLEVPNNFHLESLYRGAYPELIEKKYKLFDDWFSSYIETYLEKDLRYIANVGDLRDFQKLIQMLAVNTSCQLNLSNYAKNLGIDVKTIKRWISILEASFIIFLLPPYYRNLGKRITKSPKIYFYDVGFVAHLCGINSKDLFEKGPMYDAIFENYIVSECLKKQLHKKTHAKLYYYKTSDGAEIDLIIDHKRYREFIEIKTTETFKAKMTRSIETFMEKTDSGYLIYRGKTQRYLENIEVLNYRDYLTKH